MVLTTSSCWNTHWESLVKEGQCCVYIVQKLVGEDRSKEASRRASDRIERTEEGCYHPWVRGEVDQTQGKSSPCKKVVWDLCRDTSYKGGVRVPVTVVDNYFNKLTKDKQDKDLEVGAY